ncbi:hypothetical protein IQ265_02780 [Nodosilinea sp. LEGE 06152]|uniref:hypothetical protein n=1 Tax=Nodosilinea sp. LEGE 06152 TaxID=2777966 RepID=UPI00187F7676|nr:hypothetical protein [Nodosilinea sp. LEGE 06152]MBE9155760.1 hypothetical protein [Nodosilinea sp. LEGE 06152]
MQEMLNRPVEVAVKLPKITRFLGAAVALAAVGHIVVHALSFLFDITNTPFVGIFLFFSMGQEANLPTYISALNLLLSGVLCGIIAFHEPKLKNRLGWHWAGLSAGLVLMSIDEAAKIHEGIVGVFLEMSIGRGTGIFYYLWYLVYIPIVVIVGFLYFPFLKCLPLRYSARFCLAASVFLSGAIGLEMLESVLKYAQINTAISMLFEETLEMLGIVILIHTLLMYLSERRFALTLNFANSNRDK